jgi:hypothetical protein
MTHVIAATTLRANSPILRAGSGKQADISLLYSDQLFCVVDIITAVSE